MCYDFKMHTYWQMYPKPNIFSRPIKPRLHIGCNNSKPTYFRVYTASYARDTLWVTGQRLGASLTTKEKPAIPRHRNFFSLLVCIHISEGRLLILPLCFPFSQIRRCFNFHHKTYYVLGHVSALTVLCKVIEFLCYDKVICYR